MINNISTLTREGVIQQRRLKKLRAGQPIGINTLDKVCEILGKQPGDIIEYKKD